MAACNRVTRTRPFGNFGRNVARTEAIYNFDLGLHKEFPLWSETSRLQFRSEFFNIFNHPNFNAPGFGGNGVVAIPGSLNFTPNGDGTFGTGTFGESGSTRDAPYDPRQIQFALKLYF